MSKRGLVPPVSLSADEWRDHLAQDEQLRSEVRRLQTLVAQLEVRRPLPPEWVKSNAPERTGGEPKKRGAREGHESHHRPAPSVNHDSQEIRLACCPKCGEELWVPSEVDERIVEAIVPGHVRVTKHRIGHYR